jgi:hypothetical protein
VSLMPKQLGFQKGMNSSVGYSTVQQLCCGFFSFLRTLRGFLRTLLDSWPLRVHL